MAPLFLLVSVQEDFAPVWTKVEKAIRQSYYAREKRKAEMERRLADAAPRARAAKSRAEFDATVDAMIAGFHDSHFDMLTDEEQGYYMMDGIAQGEKAAAMPNVGAWFRRVEDGYTVQMVLEGSPAEEAGLRVGDLVTGVDGEPFTPIAALRGRVGKTATFTYRRGGVEALAPVAVARTPALRMFLDATQRSARMIERDGKRIGYLHLWTQASDDFARELAKSVAEKNLDAFVLDLRGGFGGHPYGYGERFLPQGKKPAEFTKPLVVLIDRGSRSAKELLSYNLQKTHRATLVGETTAGNVLGTYPNRLESWFYLEIPMADFNLDGVRLEGRGVFPDVAVSPMIDAMGHDLALERALEIALKPTEK